jgi:hypothetical protein
MPDDTKNWKETTDPETGEVTVEHPDSEIEAFHAKYEADADRERALKAQLDLPAGMFLSVHDGLVDLELSGGAFRNMDPRKAVAVVKDLKAVLLRHSLKAL